MAVIIPLNEQKGRTRKPGLDGILALVEQDLQAVNQVVVDRMQSRVELIPALAGHIVAAGGKRLRPMLTLTAAKLRWRRPG